MRHVRKITLKNCSDEIEGKNEFIVREDGATGSRFGAGLKPLLSGGFNTLLKLIMTFFSVPHARGARAESSWRWGGVGP